MDNIDKPLSYNNWSLRQVITWLKGLDTRLEPYIDKIEAKEVTGKWLNLVTPEELLRLGIVKVGHQILLMNRIRHLQMHYTLLETESMQIIVFRVSRCCLCINAAMNAWIAITQRQGNRDPQSDSIYPGVSDDIQAALAHVINCVLNLMTAVNNASFWLSRLPFAALPDMREFRKYILQYALLINDQASALISDSTKKHKWDFNYVEDLQMKVESVLQNFNDSLMLTPCCLELVQIHKGENTGFGLNFHTTQTNIHVIESVNHESPAFCTGRLSEGDEIIEVNDQIVIGWQHQSVLNLMLQHPKRMSLRLRKRPTHLTDSTYYLGGGGRRPRVLPPQNPTAEALSQAQIFARQPRRKRPLLTNQLHNSPLGTTQEAVEQPYIAISPTSNSIPDAPPYSISSSSSSSRYPSVRSDSCMNNALLHTLESNMFRMTSSSPTTPVLHVRDKSNLVKGDNSNQRIIVGSPSHLPKVSCPYSIRSHTLSPPFALQHRRTSSGGPLFASCPTDDKPLALLPGCTPPSGGRKLQAMDTRIRTSGGWPQQFHRGSMDDINGLKNFLHKSKYHDHPLACEDMGGGRCQGWLLYKKPNAVYASYKKRWCVLDDLTFSFYRSPEDTVPEGTIEIRDAIISSTSPVKSARFRFVITAGENKFTFATDTEVDRLRWTNVLGLKSIDQLDDSNASAVGGFSPGYVTSEHCIRPIRTMSPTINFAVEKNAHPTSKSLSIKRTDQITRTPWNGGGLKNLLHPIPIAQSTTPPCISARSSSLSMVCTRHSNSSLSSCNCSSPRSSILVSQDRSPSVPAIVFNNDSFEELDYSHQLHGAPAMHTSFDHHPTYPVIYESISGKQHVIRPGSTSSDRSATRNNNGRRRLIVLHNTRQRSYSPMPHSSSRALGSKMANNISQT